MANNDDNEKHTSSRHPCPYLVCYRTHAGSWASWLLQATAYGKVIEMGIKQPLAADKGDFFILLSGCIIVFGVAQEGAGKSVFVDALRREMSFALYDMIRSNSSTKHGRRFRYSGPEGEVPGLHE
jgi:hypothetical protein